eukprot:scaffold26471_cov113-Isochrysis_galbana.AAC.1
MSLPQRRLPDAASSRPKAGLSLRGLSPRPCSLDPAPPAAGVGQGTSCEAEVCANTPVFRVCRRPSLGPQDLLQPALLAAGVGKNGSIAGTICEAKCKGVENSGEIWKTPEGIVVDSFCCDSMGVGAATTEGVFAALATRA